MVDALGDGSAPSPESIASAISFPRDFFAIFRPTTERGAALSVVADLDSEIGEFLQKVMVDDSKRVTQMFGDQGALGSFGGRIRFSYLLGLIDAQTYEELEKINTIRNAFAHKKEADDFKYPRIQGVASSLNILGDRSVFGRWLHYIRPVEGMSDKNYAYFLTQNFKGDGIDVTEHRWAFAMTVTIAAQCFQVASAKIGKAFAKASF
jgi:hypothetical protein